MDISFIFYRAKFLIVSLWIYHVTLNIEFQPIDIVKEEEEVWTDFSRDEVEVKDQLTDAFLQEFIDDTVQTFSRIYKNREK